MTNNIGLVLEILEITHPTGLIKGRVNGELEYFMLDELA